MSILKRRILTIFFILLFLVLAPMIVFYANGNILGTGWNILATGGIFIKSMQSGAELSVNGKQTDIISFFTRDYLLKNLKPGIYTILVKKEGYNDWTNKINVYASLVTESNVFMLPTKIDIIEIAKTLVIEKNIGTTTVRVSKPNANYEVVSNFFNESSLLKKDISVLSTTTNKIVKYTLGSKQNPVENRRLAIWKEGQDAFIGWNGGVDSSPKIFCVESDSDINCQKQIKIYSFESSIRNLDFFPGESEVIIVATGNYIFAVEAEENTDKKLQVLYTGKEPDFRVFNNIIYIKDGEFIGQIEI
jgi:hypothetical protein